MSVRKPTPLEQEAPKSGEFKALAGAENINQFGALSLDRAEDFASSYDPEDVAIWTTHQAALNAIIGSSAALLQVVAIVGAVQMFLLSANQGESSAIFASAVAFGLVSVVLLMWTLSPLPRDKITPENISDEITKSLNRLKKRRLTYLVGWWAALAFLFLSIAPLLLRAIDFGIDR